MTTIFLPQDQAWEPPAGWAGPTTTQVECLLAYALTGSCKRAAHRLERSEQSVKNNLSRLHRQAGLDGTLQTVFYLWPALQRRLAADYQLVDAAHRETQEAMDRLGILPALAPIRPRSARERGLLVSA